MHQVLRLVRCLKILLYGALTEHPHLLSDAVEDNSSSNSSVKDSNYSIKVASCRLIVAVLADLYSRWLVVSSVLVFFNYLLTSMYSNIIWYHKGKKAIQLVDFVGNQ